MKQRISFWSLIERTTILVYKGMCPLQNKLSLSVSVWHQLAVLIRGNSNHTLLMDSWLGNTYLWCLYHFSNILPNLYMGPIILLWKYFYYKWIYEHGRNYIIYHKSFFIVILLVIFVLQFKNEIFFVQTSSIFINVWSHRVI